MLLVIAVLLSALLRRFIVWVYSVVFLRERAPEVFVGSAVGLGVEEFAQFCEAGDAQVVAVCGAECAATYVDAYVAGQVVFFDAAAVARFD